MNGCNSKEPGNLGISSTEVRTPVACSLHALSLFHFFDSNNIDAKYIDINSVAENWRECKKKSSVALGTFVFRQIQLERSTVGTDWTDSRSELYLSLVHFDAIVKSISFVAIYFGEIYEFVITSLFPCARSL